MTRRLVLLSLALAAVWGGRALWRELVVEKAPADLSELGMLEELFVDAADQPVPLSMGADPGRSVPGELRIDSLPSVWVVLRDGALAAAELVEPVELLDERVTGPGHRVAGLGSSGAILGSPTGVRFLLRTVEAIEGSSAPDSDRQLWTERCWDVLERGLGGYAGTRAQLLDLVGRLRRLSPDGIVSQGRIHSHRIARGETLSRIVGRLRVAFDRPWTVDQIAGWNGIDEPDQLRPGDVLEFPLEQREARLNLHVGLCVVQVDAGARTGCLVELPVELQGLALGSGRTVRVQGWKGGARLVLELAERRFECQVETSERVSAAVLLPEGVVLRATR